MFRFTIRDVLWLTLFVAICVAWWVDVRRRDVGIMVAEERVADAEFKVDRARAEVRRISEIAREQYLRLQIRAHAQPVNDSLRAADGPEIELSP